MTKYTPWLNHAQVVWMLPSCTCLQINLPPCSKSLPCVSFICSTVFFYRFIHHLNVPFLSSLPLIQEVIVPWRISCKLFSQWFRFWPAAVRPWTSACVWMLWWMFHRTSVLVTGLRRKSEFQINVLSCNMLTVHVFMNCPCTHSSTSVSFLFLFFCIFSSCVLLFYFLVFLVCTVSTQEHFNFPKSKGLVM